MTGKDARKPKGSSNKFKRVTILSICTVVVIGTSIAVRYYWPTAEATAEQNRINNQSTRAPRQTPNAANRGATPISKPNRNTMAIVNGEKITRQELADECLRHYGKEVLALLVNRYLINQHCKARGIKVERVEIDAEVARLAARFEIPLERWYKLLRDERGIDPEQYRMDVIWPTLALKKLAREKIKPTPQEIQKRYEAEFGVAVQCRMIGIRKDRRKADETRQLAVNNPDQFGRLAKDRSDDPSSASSYGLIPPIRKHVGEPKIERVAFALKVGEVSKVIQIEDQFVILKCEKHLKPVDVPLKKVEARLKELIRDKKLRTESAIIFTDLQKNAKVVNVYNDPSLKQKMPGVVALINGQQISKRQLAEQCMTRHQKDVIDGIINRKLIEQALRKSGLTVTNQDIHNEIVDAASRMIRKKPNGEPNVEGWLKLVTEEPGVTREIYIHDSVWPSAALKKLVSRSIKISDEDRKRGFSSNYGKRVRCQAIVLNSQKEALQVWDRVRSNPSKEHFGKLSAEYSVDPTTKSAKGEIPPINQYGGRPVIEAEAFKLRPGEISGILHSRGKFIILRCFGYTEPIKITMAEANQELNKMIFEKKLSRAMAKKFDQLQLSANIANYVNPKASKVPVKRVTDGTVPRGARRDTIPGNVKSRR